MPRIYKTYKCKHCDATFKGQHSEVMFKMDMHLRTEHAELYASISEQRHNHYEDLKAITEQAEIELTKKYPLHDMRTQFEFVPKS